MGTIVGLLWLGLGALALWRVVWAAREAHALIRRLRLPWWRTQWWAFTLGLALAAACAALPYPVSSKAMLLGFPFPGAAFELKGGVWMDFVGLVTIPALFADAVFGLLLPQLLLVRRLRRMTAKDGPAH